MTMSSTNIDVFPRRSALRLTLVGAALLSQPLRALARSKQTQITVWKDPNCGCCKDWVTHLEANGFGVKVLQLQFYLSHKVLMHNLII